MRWRTMKEAFLFLPAAAAFSLVLIRGETASAAAQRSLESCFRSVIPALFPILVLTNLMIHLGFPRFLLDPLGTVFEKLFRIRRTAVPAYMAGLLGGYPVGASAAAECCRLGFCSEEEAGRLLVFANNCSPGFLFGFVGPRLPDGMRQVLILLIAQWIVSAVIGVLLGIGHAITDYQAVREAAAARSFPGEFAASVRNGGRSMLMICAYVVFFGVFSEFLPRSALLRGTIELTGGILALPVGLWTEIIAAFLVGFGGLSVACQVFSALEGSGIPAWRYLPFRFLHGILMALAMICFRFGTQYLLLFFAGLFFAVFFLKSCRNKVISEI